MLATVDVVILACYSLGLIAIAWWVSREKSGRQKNAEDYFLASRALPWWAIGASLIAANISAEQIIGMSGSGYAIGLGIATYEWTAAIALIVIGKYFLPIFLEKKIYTMPQFLELRYDRRVRMLLAWFWLAVYIFVNLSSVLYLGGLAIETVAGVDMLYGIIFLALFSLAYSNYGGLKAIALTDIIQVTLLVLGGLAVTWLALDRIAGGGGPVQGFTLLWQQVPDKFDMILSKDSPHYAQLPGLSVLLGGLWIAHFAYWGFNQYITQRALAAKSLREAQKGIVFAAFIKLLMPLIVVVPGIAAVVLAPELERPDQAYPHMMSLLPPGLMGLTFAALVAAIVSSLGSMTNSIATIFTMDIYRTAFGSEGDSEQRLVRIGRAVAALSLLIAVVVARPLLGKFDQAFQYIQEFTGFFTPGILVIFLLGFFWKRATSHSAITAAIASVVLSLAIKLVWPEFPFLDRMGLVFIVSGLAAVVVTLVENTGVHPKAVDISSIDFSTSSAFNIATVSVCLILTVFYVTWW